MNIINQIKECKSNELYTLLGVVRHTNANLLYNRLKNDGDVHPVFKSDFLADEELNKWFVYELLNNEKHLDLKTEVDDDDYDDLIGKINEGYSMSGMIIQSIDYMTDKYIGDCSF